MLHANPHRRRSAGYTLLELAIVILVAGIITAVAVPRFADSLSYYHAESAAKRIRADLELARGHAVTSSSDQTVSFLVDSDRYSVFPGPKDLDHPSQTYTVDLSEPPYQASLVSVNFGGDGNVVFNGYGLADNGGTVVIRAGNYQQTISVDQETGNASLPSPPSTP